MYSGSGIVYLVWKVIPSILDKAGIEDSDRHHAYAALEQFAVGMVAKDDRTIDQIADSLRYYYGD